MGVETDWLAVVFIVIGKGALHIRQRGRVVDSRCAIRGITEHDRFNM